MEFLIIALVAIAVVVGVLVLKRKDETPVNPGTDGPVGGPRGGNGNNVKER